MRSKTPGALLAGVAAGICAVLTVAVPAKAASANYRLAMPGYRYEFPRDHFNHPGYQTEWWYYTGNLETATGRRFGFELTFFRQALARENDRSPWNLEDLYLAHLALTDVDAGEFHHTSRINRAGPGLAGADQATRRIWNGNWEVRWREGVQHLRAVTPDFTLILALEPRKPPVIHGRDGVSQKAAGKGRASHYISFTRLAAGGELTLHHETFPLTGSAWMDHEFFTHQLEDGQTGWDWMSIQLDDGWDLMLFRLRRKDGSLDPFSAGTAVAPNGHTRHLSAAEFRLEPARKWQDYPVEWRITVPPLSLSLRATTPLDNQEFKSSDRYSPAYWEGAMDYTGTRGGRPVAGRGYLEMTGYGEPVRLGPE